MKIGPKYKICKRLGAPVFEKCQTQKFALSESRGKKKRRRRLSDYGKQLMEKQKARYTYSITERQFRRFVREAMSSRTLVPTQALYQRLEMRLDNVAFRLGFAKTRRMARQLVSHGHFLVNGKKIDVPSHKVKEGDTVEVRRKDRPVFLELQEEMKDYVPPAWIAVNEKEKNGEIVGTPSYEASEHQFDLQKVFEFYSR